MHSAFPSGLQKGRFLAGREKAKKNRPASNASSKASLYVGRDLKGYSRTLDSRDRLSKAVETCRTVDLKRW
jgi:hypothetical protein